ncbi:MAG: undecaprenyldiphospho-muramoylpentapeptide beta-N-acetylglucosaminyltransferase [Acidobacteria bacterium]|nr:undecaprenyldiphospho-muramoylpentapeptide beta-N-acetylglucosaminyltransferase [Acidobacteriota bacterium]
MGLSVLVAGGGTGGHLYPGIAVARELLARVPDAEVTFVGTSTGLEARVLPHEGFALDTIRSAGLKGGSVRSIIRGIALLPVSAVDAWRVLSRRRPSVVIGVGGYSSGPVVLLAAVRGIPTLLMEQNAMPGVTNRLLARIVDTAAVTYQESARFFGRKAVLTGNPVRPEFFASTQDVAREREGTPGRVRVLVFGGSQGAHAINVAMADAAATLAIGPPGLVVTHQTGEQDQGLVRSAYQRAGLDARVEPFLFDMDREMKAADLVVCRAGATTLAELMAARRASILVPLPTATDDHQRHNAQALSAQGAVRVLDQRELDGGRLAAEVLAVAGDPDLRRSMENAAKNLARPDAAKVIVDEVLALAR